ncbi:hypothetical protein PHLCEN_2v11157 [Hermanssonia centrifuga]|uniref:Uncharacterized protein n=1 Tax=Hermanssonia centrifuga TaxID=98765 RepID=A0A2R6NLT1_9APHY|nr:hypothetical protein PHLCEN_2v11157 [Hermanssonia centrifuga]
MQVGRHSGWKWGQTANYSGGSEGEHRDISLVQGLVLLGGLKRINRPTPPPTMIIRHQIGCEDYAGKYTYE